MSSLRVRGLSFEHSSAVVVFDEVDLHVHVGWYGLVGANGAGKTTLLRLISAEITPDAGAIALQPASARVVLCPQAVDELSSEIEALAGANDGVAARVRGELRLDADDLARWPTLSPGERKRWQIATALWREPEVLLLDEPTNHLDAEARTLLVDALSRFHGIGVVVSHDRALLESLTTTTLRIAERKVNVHHGSYEQARREWEAEAHARREMRDRLRDEQRLVARRLADARRDRAAAEANKSAGKRMKDKNDHDARGMGAKVVAGWAEKGLGRRVAIVRERLARTTARLDAIEVERSFGRSLFVGFEPARTPHPFVLDVESVRAGERTVLGRTSVSIARDARIRVHGTNGAGKTTLLRALIAHARIPPSKMLHLPQELDDEEAEHLVRSTRSLPNEERGRVFSLLAALGVDPQRLGHSERPSPGELRKLALASALGRHVWALVLDEPTNHLDLPSIERLEQALADYPGALILVTHDDAFAQRCTRETWTLSDGAIERAA